MANPDRGEFDLEIGGEVKTLRFGFAQFREMDQALAGTHGSLMKAMQNGALFEIAPLAVRIGLKHDEPKLTPRKVEGWFDDLGPKATETASDIIGKLAKVMNPSAFEDEEKAKGNEEPAGA